MLAQETSLIAPIIRYNLSATFSAQVGIDITINYLE